MSEEPYSNRELDSKFANLEKAEMARHQEKIRLLGEIKVQTVRTNGRVTKLERAMLVIGTATAVLIFLKFPELRPLLGLV